MGHHKGKYFLFMLAMGKKKKKFLQKKQPQCVLSVTWFSKTEFSKEKSGYQSCHLADSLVKSPLNPVCLSHYIAGHSAPASERGPRDEATAFRALWGISFPALGPQLPIISFQHPSPQHSLPPRPSPGECSFPWLC